MAIGVVFIVYSGENPQNVNLTLQAGVTIFTSALFLLFERLVTGGSNKELLEEVEQLRTSVIDLTEEIERLQHFREMQAK
jgi:hypothetical protein